MDDADDIKRELSDFTYVSFYACVPASVLYLSIATDSILKKVSAAFRTGNWLKQTSSGID